ncbi:MAG: Bax inhibitor-1/YccA family protein [Acholeplasmatales bacterium]|jgi:uncharacterized YccA/Bax inhibitor family protein|nr:Bax inhibitor-1/YccA family protein [Acholeplasmatales bacterium]
MRIRSSNPYFGRIEKAQGLEATIGEEKLASYKGIFLKTLLLVAVLLISGLGSIFLFALPYNIVIGILIACPIVALVCAIFGSFNLKYASFLSIIYSLAEGLMLGLLTYVLDRAYPGVGIVAIIGVGVVFLVTFALYAFKAIRVSNFFVRLFSILGVSIFIAFLLSFLISWLAPAAYAAIADNFWLMLVIYSVLIIFGAFCLILDFDRCHQIVIAQSPKKYEWWAAFGLIISIIWIYIQILRLVTLITGRRN